MKLTCKHPGACAWGSHYPPQQGGETATNGSAPGYVKAQDGSGRLLMIAELLRLGHAPADVAEALKHTDGCSLEGAIRVLTQKKEATQV